MKHHMKYRGTVTSDTMFAPKDSKLFACVCGTTAWLQQGKDGILRVVSWLGSETCPGEWEVNKRARLAREAK